MNSETHMNPLSEEDRRRIEGLVGGMSCPKDFACVKSGFENVCKGEYNGTHHCLECLEDCPDTCVFAAKRGPIWFCECPLRWYFAEHLNK